MDISLTEDQIMIADTIRQLLSDVWPREKMRAYVESMPDSDDSILWGKLVQTDFNTILAPEEFNGGGASILDVMPVMEQFGYALAPTRFTTSAIVSTAALSQCVDSPLKASLLDGTTKLCTILDEDLTAETNGDELTLSGTAKYVPDVQGATHAVVLTNDHVAVIDLASAQAGIAIEDVDTVDATRRVAHVHFNDVVIAENAQLAATTSPADIVARTKDVKMLVTVCDSLGGAQRALDMAVAYSRERFQFGRPIGSFQSLQHLMADAYVAVENLRSATWYAAHALQHQAEDLEFALLAASVLATKTYLQASDLNIQVHGGMGFTIEVDAYLYAARAKVNEVQDGTLGQRTARIAKWLRTADLPSLVEYLGGQHRQLESSMFAIA